MFAYIGHSGPSPPLNHGITRERSLSVESAIAEEVVTSLDPTTAEVAEMLFSLREGKRSRNAFESSQGTSRQDEDEAPLNPEERSSSSSGSACSTPSKVPCKALTSTSNSRQLVPLTTRSYVWRGPKRSLLNPKLANACPVQLLSSDPDEDEDVDHAVGRAPAAPACAPAAIAASPAAPGVAERSDRDKEWAALTTWLRMNLHQPRTAKREVLFIGSQSEERGWRFFLNPALAWDDVSLETKMRLRTLPQETVRRAEGAGRLGPSHSRGLETHGSACKQLSACRLILFD
ncbi:hypothetical protein PLESTF_001315700 [Pleodorina starrii]|nr:hypothetical protein PLESTF_001315700 [Pleodorina starrii]